MDGVQMRKGKKYYGKQGQYITGIDGLRAIAVLMVLAYHLQFPFAKGGLLGVTVFFVISGFLITRILVSELGSTRTIDLKKFWIRRIRRLLPAVLAMVSVLIFAGAVWNRVLFTKTCSDLLSAIFCYNNWHQIFRNVSYFENAGMPSPLTHCWSLSVEAQFYLVYPLLLLFFAKFPDWRKRSACATLLLAILSMGAMWILFDPSKDPSRVYYGTDTRVFSLLSGAFLVFVTADGPAKKKQKRSPASCPPRDAAGIAGLLAILYMAVRVDGYSSFLYRGGQGIASACTVLVIYSLLDTDGILSRLLSAVPLKWISDRSYGIYLWHYPVILLVSGGKKSPWWVSILEILLTILLSALSYRFIETPIRRGIIGKSIAVIRSEPETKRERRKQIRTLKRSIRAVSAAFVTAAGVLLCILFVPRENALDHIEELERQEKKAEEIARRKTLEWKESAELNAAQDNAELNPAQDSAELDPAQDGAEGFLHGIAVKSAKRLRENKAKEGGETPLSMAAQADVETVLTDEELLSGLRLLLIGDSVAMGATDEFYSAFPGSISDVAVGRQTTESIGIYDTYVNVNGWNGDGVIFALGANGLLYHSLDTLRDMLGPDRPLFVVTVRVPYVSWEGPNNEEIYAFTNTRENTYLVDWYKISEGHGEYFAGDGIHLTYEGCQAYVNGIKEAAAEVYRKQ